MTVDDLRKTLDGIPGHYPVWITVVGDEMPAGLITQDKAMIRIWEGKTDKGVPVKAWVATVSPQTHDEAANAEFARDLREVKGEHHAHAYDLRLFAD